MLRNSLTIGLVFAVFLLQGCRRATSKPVESPITVEVAKPLEPVQEKVTLKQSGGKVEFKGVSFSYNPQIFGEVEMEEIAEHPLENEMDRPFNEQAQHLHFTFKDIKQNQITNIKIFPIESFRRTFAVSQSYIEQFDELLNGLRKLTKDKDLRIGNEIPLIHFGNGGQELQTKVKHFSFLNGTGILFITHWSYEVALISNENLEYVYGGLTSDEKYYVLARMPVKVGFLPKDSPEEFEEYKRSYIFEDYPNPEKIKKRYKDYVSKITTRLEKLPADKYEPNLKYFEEIISSLKIEK